MKTIQKALILFACIMLGTLVFPPVFGGFVNRVEPWVCGMPFLIFWLVVVNISVASALILLWFVDRKQEV